MTTGTHYAPEDSILDVMFNNAIGEPAQATRLELFKAAAAASAAEAESGRTRIDYIDPDGDGSRQFKILR